MPRYAATVRCAVSTTVGRPMQAKRVRCQTAARRAAAGSTRSLISAGKTATPDCRPRGRPFLRRRAVSMANSVNCSSPASETSGTTAAMVKRCILDAALMSER